MLKRIIINLFSIFGAGYIYINYGAFSNMFYIYIDEIKPPIILFIFFVIFIFGVFFGRISKSKDKHYNFSTNKKRKKFINSTTPNTLFEDIIKKIFLHIMTFISILFSILVIIIINSNFLNNGVYKVVFIFSFLIIMSNILSKIYIKTYDI